MAISTVRAITESEPPGRLNALVPVRSKKSLLFVYALFFIPMMVFSLVFPLTGLVAWAVFYRVRHYRWTALFTAVVVVLSFASLFWFSLLLSAYFSTVISSFGTGGWWAAVSARPFVQLIGTASYGSAAGLLAAWWDWQRKPFFKQPDRAPTLVGRALIARDRKAIAEGTYSRDGYIALGIEEGPRSLGRVIELKISEMTHAIVLGITNTGKTQTCYRVVEGFIRAGLPVIEMDMKGSQKTVETMRSYAAKYGRPFYLFTLTGGGRWDPLRDKPDASSQKDLLMSVGQWSDAHYKNLANTALLDIFTALNVGGVDSGQSVLQAVLRLMEPGNLQQYANKHLVAPEQADLRARVLARAAEIASNPNAFSGLKSLLQSMVYSETGQFFSPGEGMFSLRQAFEENAVVLFSFNYMMYEDTSQAISAMVLADVKALGAQLMEAHNKKEWLFWAEEFTKSRAGDIAPMMQQIRESELKMLLSTQSISDILGAGHSGYAGGADAYEGVVLSQASTIICHKVEKATALWVEEQSGDGWSVEAGSVETTRKDSILDADSGASGDRGWKQLRIGPAVKASEIQQLAPGEAVMKGAFEAGKLLKVDRVKRKKGAPAPDLLVNRCAVVRSAVSVDADERVNSGQVQAINEIDPAAVPSPVEDGVIPVFSEIETPQVANPNSAVIEGGKPGGGWGPAPTEQWGSAGRGPTAPAPARPAAPPEDGGMF